MQSLAIYQGKDWTVANVTKLLLLYSFIGYYFMIGFHSL